MCCIRPCFTCYDFLSSDLVYSGAYTDDLSQTAPATFGSLKKLPTEVRFHVGLGDFTGRKSLQLGAATVGPNSYAVEGSLIKKSFNVGFKPKSP